MVKIPGFSRKNKGLEGKSEEEVRMRIRTLENENKFIEGEIDDLKKKRDTRFKEGLNSSETHRKLLARDILNMDKQITMKNQKLSDNLDLITGLSTVANAKGQDTQTASNAIFDEIDQTDKGKLMASMTNAAYKREMRRSKVRDFGKITDISASISEPEESTDVSMIMDQWKTLDEGSTTLTPETVDSEKSEEKNSSTEEEKDKEHESV